MPSFDVVSKIDTHELDNALQQAHKEIAQRFDFRNTNTGIEEKDGGITITANADGRIDAAWDVLSEKLARRKIPLEAFTRGEIEPAAGGNVRQSITMQVGIPTDKAKEMVKAIKGAKIKVQAAIQGDTLRVTGKKRDDLQEVMALLRKGDFKIAMQFENFRD